MSNVLYIRTSTKEQTPELQLADIQTLSPPEDSVILRERLSAWKENTKRPEFERLLSMIKSGKVNGLYVWDFDRLYRNRLKLKELLILCKVHNVSLHSFNQSWIEKINSIPEPFNEMFMDMLINFTGWIGEEESVKKSNRVKMAVRETDKGTFSYKGNRWGRKSFPAQTISRVMELHQQGKSIRKIASEVNVYDANNNSKKISKSAVQQILTRNAVAECP